MSSPESNGSQHSSISNVKRRKTSPRQGPSYSTVKIVRRFAGTVQKLGGGVQKSKTNAFKSELEAELEARTDEEI